MPIPFILGALGYSLVSTTAAAATVAGAAAAGAAVVAGVSALNKDSKKNDLTKPQKIELFQKNLTNLRTVGDIKVESITEILDITRQAVWNLENLKSKMSATQYAAWYSIFAGKVFAAGEQTLLARFIDILATGIDKYTAEEIDVSVKILDQVARAKKAGLDKDIIQSLANNLPKPR